MEKKLVRKLVVVTAVASFIGGAATSAVFSAGEALAAKPAAPKAAKPVVAQEFRLVDAKGNTQVRIGLNADGLATVFWTYHGKDPKLEGKEQSFVIATMPGFAPKPANPQ